VTEPDGLTYDELTRDLFPRLTGGIRWGLERTLELLAHVGNPQNSFRSIHVGGTNGKGSVAATLEAILRADGRRTGLYTSPHLCSFRERVRVNGTAISEADLVAAARKLWPDIQRLSPSFFEATTAIGFLALAEAGVETAVIEVGLGGRLDATNVIEPALSVITNIALDHAEYLGNTIESVAVEKAGIIKPGVPVLTGEHDETVLRIFRERAHALEAPLQVLPVLDPVGIQFDVSGTRFVVDGVQFKTSLIGAHQATNAALAIRAAELLPVAWRPAAAAIERGVAGVQWPGRLQVERIAGETWIFDVAHNVAGVHALVESLRRLDLPRPLVLLVGILGDKDWAAMLPPLFSIADQTILTVPPTAPANRAWDPVAALQEVPNSRAEIVHDFAEALQHAAQQGRGGTILVTGSFHTVGDALAAHGKFRIDSHDANPDEPAGIP
jgi:dihydrofolate synthase / folylpolyglutamate synthase